MAVKKTTKVAEVKKQLPAVKGKPMGRGFEEADAESFAIPFLAMLQKMSPAADADSDEYVKGAKAGMFFNTVTREVFESVEIIPCAYQRRFNRWAPADSGGGFKGQFLPSAIAGMEASGVLAQSDEGRWYFALPDGSVNEKKCDILTDTRMHYCLHVLPNGDRTGVLVSLSRTQMKKSKNWMTLMQQQGGDMFKTVYECKAKDEENEKGKWKGWVIELGRATESEELAEASSFYESVSAGKVKVKMEDAED